jgi:hypothetical protein
MADYGSHTAQARRLRELSTQTQAEVEARNRARYAAYRWLAEQPTGQLLLDDWCLLLLQPALTPEDTGERRFIQRVLKVIREDAPTALGGENA